MIKGCLACHSKYFCVSAFQPTTGLPTRCWIWSQTGPLNWLFNLPVTFPFSTLTSLRSNNASQPKRHIGITLFSKSRFSFSLHLERGLMCAATNSLTGNNSIWLHLKNLIWNGRKLVKISPTIASLSHSSSKQISETNGWLSLGSEKKLKYSTVKDSNQRGKLCLLRMSSLVYQVNILGLGSSYQIFIESC